MRSSSSIAQCALLCSTVLAGLASAAEIKVKAGGKIQDAINKANPGDQITVAKGTYPENLLVTKNNIKLVGQNGAVIVPPSPAVPNGCSGLVGAGTEAGICVLGDVELTNDVVNDEHRKVTRTKTPVKNVLIKGFEIDSFSGLNIAVVGGENVEVRENTLVDGVRYGALTIGSTGTIITRNTVRAPTDLYFIGICMDDKSTVSVTNNVISDYQIGLCMQTNGADVGHNKVSNTCVGGFIDPFVRDVSFTHNKISGLVDAARVVRCNNLLGINAGLVINAAINANVQHNDVTGVTDFGNPNGFGFAAAIMLLDDLSPQHNQVQGAKVDFNDLANNQFNVLMYTAGVNEVKHNTCTSPSDNCNF